MPLVLHEHDGTTNSRTMNALVQNFSAAAATDLENGQKMACMRLLLAFRNASAAAAETSTGDFGLTETSRQHVFQTHRDLYCPAIAPPSDTRRAAPMRHAIAMNMPRASTWTCT